MKKLFLLLTTITLLILTGYEIMGKNSRKAAIYHKGKTYNVEQFEFDSSGGLKKIINPGSPLDQLIVEVPPGTFREKTTASFGFNDGVLDLVSGEGSAIVVDFQLSNDQKFNNPIKISLPANTDRMMLGFAFDHQGLLEPIDTFKENNRVFFYTFKPILFTWVYWN